MVVIVALLTIALLLVWRELPTGSKPLPEAPIGDVKPVPAASTSTEQVACEAARGKWVECGNPCHGKPGDVCITKCEPQCLCGGIAGWMCPANLTCTDMVPEAGAPDALGVCRAFKEIPPAGAIISRETPEGMICDPQNEYCVDKGVSGSLLANPFTVTVDTVKATGIMWSLQDAKGNELLRGFGSGTSSPFVIRDFMLSVPATAAGTLYIGSEMNGLEIPVRLPTATMTVKYFARPAGGSASGEPINVECSDVIALEAIVPRSSLPVETTLRYLLEGKLWEGMAAPSAIPRGTRLESLKVSGGTATAVFSPELQNYGGGSCNVQAIRAQIEQTLKQFSSIKNVVISVVGKTAAETLQP